MSIDPVECPMLTLHQGNNISIMSVINNTRAYYGYVAAPMDNKTKPTITRSRIAVTGPAALELNGELYARRIALLCVGLVIMVAAADYFLFFRGWFPSRIVARSFDISSEESVGTWLSSNIALFTGLFTAAIFTHSRKHDSRAIALGWALMALFFLYVSVDDAAKLHERLGTAVRVKYEQIAEISLDSWFPSWGWQIFIAPFFVAYGCYLLWFLWHAVAPVYRGWVFLAFSCFGIAVSLDFVEGMDLAWLENEDAVHLLQLAEETLEMLGTTAFLFVVMLSLNDRIGMRLRDRLAQPGHTSP
jgi:hypothetical protein